MIGNYKLCGHIFSQHGGSQFSGWWFDKNMQNVTIQGYDLPNNMSYNYVYILAHVCIDDVDVDTIRKKSTNIWWEDLCPMQ